MTSLLETAAAKVNLTLRVLGRRADGYHELESLVAFARYGDALELAPGEALSLAVEGPFAAALGAGNLVLDAARLVAATWPESVGGAFRLVKRLPVAGGVGGGSADAAAALRLMVRANPGLTASEVEALCPRLGADVKVCFHSRASLMTGIGEAVRPLARFPAIAAVLANPGAALPTASVFEALGAGGIGPEVKGETAAPDSFEDTDCVVAYVRARSNDLEAPALRLVPAISEVLDALRRSPGCLVARLSGSGPTCFGLFESEERAMTAEQAISEAHPGWWAVATVLS